MTRGIAVTLILASVLAVLAPRAWPGGAALAQQPMMPAQPPMMPSPQPMQPTMSAPQQQMAPAPQQMPAQCASFPKLTEEASKRGAAVSAAIKARIDPKQLCGLMNNFITAEGAVVKFLVENQTWCGVPQQAITVSKANHEKSLKFRTQVCSAGDAPRAKTPTLSDAIKSTPLDTAKNTKAGVGGTFDTLTGNPLAR